MPTWYVVEYGMPGVKYAVSTWDWYSSGNYLRSPSTEYLPRCGKCCTAHSTKYILLCRPVTFPGVVKPRASHHAFTIAIAIDEVVRSAVAVHKRLGTIQYSTSSTFSRDIAQSTVRPSVETIPRWQQQQPQPIYYSPARSIPPSSSQSPIPRRCRQGTCIVRPFRLWLLQLTYMCRYTAGASLHSVHP